MNPDELFEDFELLIIEAFANGTQQSSKEYCHFLAQVYAASRDTNLNEEFRGRTRGKLIALLGALQKLPIDEIRESVKPILGETTIVESQFDADLFLKNPYALLLYTDEFPLPFLLALNHFSDVINIGTQHTNYASTYFAAKKFANVRCLFHPSLSLETLQSISATAEPFTPLIMIDPFISVGDKDYRDNGSIVFDIILQLNFINEFRECTGSLSKTDVRIKMYQAGAQYAEDLFYHRLNAGSAKKHLRYETSADAIRIHALDQTPETEEYIAYCVYLAESLYRSAQQEVERCGGAIESTEKKQTSLANVRVTAHTA